MRKLLVHCNAFWALGLEPKIQNYGLHNTLNPRIVRPRRHCRCHQLWRNDDRISGHERRRQRIVMAIPQIQRNELFL